MENTTQMFCTKSTCCIESTGMSIDPMEIDGTIAAGQAGRETFNTSCGLAKIYFPDQKYRAGFKPESAHCHGTMFPELVRLYE